MDPERTELAILRELAGLYRLLRESRDEPEREYFRRRARPLVAALMARLARADDPTGPMDPRD